MSVQIPTFDYFWDDVIFPSIQRCVAEMDKQVSHDIDFSCREYQSYKLELSEVFKRKREWLKREYLSKEDDPTLDFHKFSALFCRSIIGNKPFLFSLPKAEKLFKEISEHENMQEHEKLQWEINNVYFNYKCAFYVARGIAYIDLFYWAIEKAKNDSINSELYEKFQQELNKRKDLETYKKSPNHDDFITSMIVSLMKNDILMRDFDYLTFAASMFQWQEHTKLTLLIDILAKKGVESKSILKKAQDLM